MFSSFPFVCHCCSAQQEMLPAVLCCAVLSCTLARGHGCPFQPLPPQPVFRGDHRCVGLLTADGPRSDVVGPRSSVQGQVAAECHSPPKLCRRSALEKDRLAFPSNHPFPLRLLLLFFLPQTMALEGHRQTVSEPGLAHRSLHL